MNDLNERFCFRPFELLEIHNESSATDKIRTYCCCPMWIKTSFGHIYDPDIDKTNLLIKNDFDEIWNSEKAIDFRKSVLDGSFRHCNIDRCPYIQYDTLPFKKDHEDFIQSAINNKYQVFAPKEINLCYDRSCNLSCPSCRKNFFFIKKDSEEYVLKTRLNDFIIDFIHRSNHEIQINCTGSGDPFASNIFQDFLSKLDYNKNNKIKILIQTNGVLFTQENWLKISNIQNLKHKSVLISLDAATEDTYNKIRVGGDWNKLMKNLEFVCELYDYNYLDHVQLDFVVQQKNFREIPQFVKIAQHFGFGAYFSRLLNWNTWTIEDFKKNDIFDIKHEEHNDFLSVINQNFDYERIFWGNVNSFRTNI